MTMLLRIFTIGLFACLAACAQGLSTDVTRFNQFTGPPMGSFSITATDDQSGSLQYTSDAALLSAELQRIGFTPVVDGATPDFVASYTASQTRYDAGKERGPVDVGVGVGGGGRSTGVGVGIGFNLGGGNNNTGYIVKLGVTMETPAGERVFEGHASALSQGKRASDVMPYLMRAVFTDFPGENGDSKTMTVTLDK